MRSGRSVENSQSSSTADFLNSRPIHDACSRRTWRQQLKLMDTVAAIVGTLDEGELFQSIISHTGRKHADFGVQRSHLTAFREALIWGLQQQFGRAFTPEMEQAWIVLYDTIQTEMVRAAKDNLRIGLHTPSD